MWSFRFLQLTFSLLEEEEKKRKEEPKKASMFREAMLLAVCMYRQAVPVIEARASGRGPSVWPNLFQVEVENRSRRSPRNETRGFA